ncbi:hypothetical protein E5676_scaffold225G00160 [Cucumis melo var. makuwa]|uniref:Uncharacterized protein n=1 Tax=Cucumis melo var. makuwa TaxID=1194695 RepID=A0A5D3DV76_CUCMM|nr:hypothetical protein E5676_scaffold225G00160 [Cucumis melo var. makuwa]
MIRIKLIGEFLLSTREYLVWLKSPESYLHGCPSGSPHFYDCVVRRDRQSGIDIDIIRVIRRDRSQPDCLSVSSGYTTDQFVLGVPLGSPKTSYVPPGSHVARVRERASSWVPLFRTLMGS